MHLVIVSNHVQRMVPLKCGVVCGRVVSGVFDCFVNCIAMLRDLSKTMDGLFEAFLKTRVGSGWEGHVGQMRKWIMEPLKKTVAA